MMNDDPDFHEDCICPYINIGLTQTQSRNLNEDCTVHGFGTDYYEQKSAEWSERLRQSWADVAEARRQQAAGTHAEWLAERKKNEDA